MLPSGRFRYPGLFIAVHLLAAHGCADPAHAISQEYKACIGQTNGVTAEMLRCANNELQRQEARLRRALLTIRDSARISVRRKDALESTQKEWEASRRKICLATAQREADGGSLAPVIATDCAVSKTTKRANRLEAIARE
jgi:uncharacterized protein YecT (DUF1311 family)